MSKTKKTLLVLLAVFFVTPILCLGTGYVAIQFGSLMKYNEIKSKTSKLNEVLKIIEENKIKSLYINHSHPLYADCQYISYSKGNYTNNEKCIIELTNSSEYDAISKEASTLIYEIETSLSKIEKNINSIESEFNISGSKKIKVSFSKNGFDSYIYEPDFTFKKIDNDWYFREDMLDYTIWNDSD